MKLRRSNSGGRKKGGDGEDPNIIINKRQYTYGVHVNRGIRMYDVIASMGSFYCFRVRYTALALRPRFGRSFFAVRTREAD